MDLTTALIEFFTALFGCGGFWTFVQIKSAKKRKKKESDNQFMLTMISKIDSEASENAKSIIELSNAIQTMKEDMDELNNSQKIYAVNLEKSQELTRAYARDRLNYLSNLYIENGYVPSEDIIPFKLLGEAYIDFGGNTETKTKFLHCIDKLPVLTKEDREELEED